MTRHDIISGLIHDIHTVRQKLMIGYTADDAVEITPSQSFVLRYVSEYNGASIKEIANRLHITSSAATQLVNALEEKKYLVRTPHPNDRRAIALALTPDAKKIIKKFKAQRIKKMTHIFDALTDAELRQYATLQKKISDFVANQ